ncbi:serine/threonine-protein kinase PknG [Micromonospora pallida]|uniref:non-specific serine/threonine protein kinase n=1 Tax=Micromonospora pallida TaxID=145854 RepID=A0A1C6SZE6_9ACTN|nr:serine/threonine-protein kinase [Micromonospora pallida]SCL34759.1 serine/threonine-protein kinase PknG [Micromonospora pallida]
MRCTRTPGCTGTVDEIGFCDRCGLAPRRTGGPPRPEPEPAPSDGPPAAGPPPDGPPSDGRTWTVAGLVSLPVLAFPADRRVLPDPAVPENQRFCAHCRAPVGRGGTGRLDHGYCGRCQTPFAFVPALERGDLVADQYEVVGYLARGGLGQVYLARDTHLDDNPVVLKRLLNKTDRNALAVEVAERRYLTTLNHPTIVRIYNFVTAPDRLFGGQAGYIVMEYLNGMSLAELREAARDPARPAAPLPLAHLLAYAHEILAALDYLHRQGLLYTDLHPGNVIRTADRIKLIDLGGVRRADDQSSPLVGTPLYQVGDRELETRGATVRSDLYAVGMLLAELGDGLVPGPGAPVVDVGMESFRRLVRRARHDEWEHRFASAAELAEQLKGVLHELLPARSGHEQAVSSTVFAPTPALFDAGLGAVPPLEHWTDPVGSGLREHGRPAPAAVATGLPVPRPMPGDPAAEFLTTVGALAPERLLDGLAAFDVPSVEIELARCRALLELGDPPRAWDALTAAGRLLDGDPSTDWRLAWHDALLALTEGDVPRAGGRFDAVYGKLPGEIAPKLALAYCAEHTGDAVRAVRYYETVWRRDRLTASAAFGLARLRLAGRDRAGAVGVLDDVPRFSRHHDAARIAVVRSLTVRFGDEPPDAAALNEAVHRLAGLRLDGGNPHGEARDRLTTTVLEAALERVLAYGPDGLDDGATLGAPPTENGLRQRLARSFRVLARQQARNRNDHGVLLDRANTARPLTLLRLREE